MKRAFPTFITQVGKDFLVYVPDLDLYTEGNSLTDAIEMARDAIGLKQGKIRKIWITGQVS